MTHRVGRSGPELYILTSHTFIIPKGTRRVNGFTRVFLDSPAMGTDVYFARPLALGIKRGGSRSRAEWRLNEISDVIPTFHAGVPVLTIRDRVG
jgi:hypothetical protein